MGMVPASLRWQALVAVMAASVAAAGCGGSPPTAPTSPPPPVPLVVSCPGNVEATSIGGESVVVTFAPPTTTGGTPPVTVVCSPASGSSFAVGTTAVTCTGTDAAGVARSCGLTVVVRLAPRLLKTRFLAFGDSLTEGVVSLPLPECPLGFAESYPTKLLASLSSRYVSQTITMVNAGLAGEQAAQGVLRLPGVLAREAPEVLLLLDGANDLIFWMNEQGVRQAAAALDTMVREAQGRGILVYLATMPPWRQGGPKRLDATLPPLLNVEIRSIAQARGARLVDLYGAMVNEMSALIGMDGLHPTEAGYDCMARTFFQALAATLELQESPASRRR